MNAKGYMRKGAVYKACLVCGLTFGVQPYRVKTAFVCSRQCGRVNPQRKAKLRALRLGVARSEDVKGKLSEIAKQRKGAKNPNWRGGKTPLVLAIRTSTRYAEWRKAVFERDSYRCVNCGKDSCGDIEAHHVVALTKQIRELRIGTVEEARSSSALWNVENGQTVCIPCHTKTDNYKSKAALS